LNLATVSCKNKSQMLVRMLPVLTGRF